MKETPDPRFRDTSTGHFSGAPKKPKTEAATVPQWAAYILLVAGLVGGVFLHHTFGDLLTSHEEVEEKGKPLAIIRPVVLKGPNGAVSLPQRAVIQVWLQGCADCMPAFRAFRDSYPALKEAWGLPIINVAYGEATVDYAKEYRVHDQLVFDPKGTALVNPLGIGTFTTLVVNERGEVVHRSRPTDEGYVESVRDAINKVRQAPVQAAP
jgi:hypothetical protein